MIIYDDRPIPKKYYKDYAEYRRSPTWKWIRNQVLIRDKFRCEDCNHIATEAHHIKYCKWGYEALENLISLCAKCHRKRHSDKPIDAQKADQILYQEFFGKYKK